MAADKETWYPNPDALRGRIAVVAGATRGAGRGIAAALGESGATVICTGRSSRGKALQSDYDPMPGRWHIWRTGSETPTATSTFW